MKIHKVDFYIFYVFALCFIGAIVSELKVGLAAKYSFMVFCFISIITLSIWIIESDEYIKIENPIQKRKNKQAIKDALFSKMKDAKGSEIDELIDKIENL